MKMTYKLLLALALAGSMTSCPSIASVTVHGKYGTYTVSPNRQVTIELDSPK